ncbi:cytochrome P450 [Peniophora sp. CONT]|nr:cytochrome P450 [Peniophora sp. CONT]
MISRVLATVVAAAVVLAGKDAYKLVQILVHPYFSPMRSVDGPPDPDGSDYDTVLKDDPLVMERWAREYGSVYKYAAKLKIPTLASTDARAIAHVLGHPDVYQKPELLQRALRLIFGAGMLTVEGDEHGKQRRVMSPAFGNAQMRDLTHIFLEKTEQLKEVLLGLIAEAESDQASVEVMHLLTKTTLDVIGLAGFDYDFEALSSGETANKLGDAIYAIVNQPPPSFLDILQIVFPTFQVIPTKNSKRLKEANAVLHRVGLQLVAEKKSEVLATSGPSVDKSTFRSKDILGLLVRANMANDLPESSRMSDAEIVAQIPTLIAAGHETTSTMMTWVLYALSLNQDAQDKLRIELQTGHDDVGDSPSMEQLHAFPYLDAVIRETLRMWPPLPFLSREARKTDVIPTEQPWTDKNGQQHDGIPVTAGDAIVVPVLAMNRSTDIWGPDAGEFKPERWLDPHHPAPHVQNVPLPGLLSFSGGPRACIGFRFAIVEMKAMLYVLIRSFRLALAVEPEELTMQAGLILRPYVLAELEKEPQLLLLISAL